MKDIKQNQGTQTCPNCQTVNYATSYECSACVWEFGMSN